METSDDSFAWTDASSDSSKNMPLVMSENNESDSDETFTKDKLAVNVEQKEKRKKQKKQDVEQLENGNIDFEINTSIKSEPNSDYDVQKNKSLKSNKNVIKNICNDSLQEAKDYLNHRVKQEWNTFVEPTPTKSNKKMKYKIENEYIEDQEAEMSTISKIDIEEHNLDSTITAVIETDTSHRKKKKKKKKTTSFSDINEYSEDPGNTVEILKTDTSKALSDVVDYHHDVDENSEVVSSTLINNSISNNPKDQMNNSLQNQISFIEGPLNKSSRISDRITFEEENTADFELEELVPNNNLSNELKQFICSNTKLTPLQSESHREHGITDDDEVWILRGPHEINIQDLENTNLMLESKKKLKMNGRTYESIVDNNVCAMPMLLHNKKKVYIKNVTLKGIINLRKRIPKVYIPYESLTLNNERSFIPLPDTKCRHPLLGIHYKKALKIPTRIAEKLNTSQRSFVPTTIVKTKKKKHKEKHEKESDIEVKPNVTPNVHSDKKKRKKKHTEQAKGPQKPYRVKQDSDCVASWESEQAIAHNLFDV